MFILLQIFLFPSQESQSTENPNPAFLAITTHTYSDAPLTFIHPKAFMEAQKPETRKKLQLKQVTCWSLLIVPEEKGSVNWVKVVVD